MTDLNRLLDDYIAVKTEVIDEYSRIKLKEQRGEHIDDGELQFVEDIDDYEDATS